MGTVKWAQDAVIEFNQKVRETHAGAKGELSGILKTGLHVEANARYVTPIPVNFIFQA